MKSECLSCLVSNLSCLSSLTGLVSNNGNLKMVLVDLIEEDFTSRAFDNIKAVHALAKSLEVHLG